MLSILFIQSNAFYLTIKLGNYTFINYKFYLGCTVTLLTKIQKAKNLAYQKYFLLIE